MEGRKDPEIDQCKSTRTADCDAPHPARRPLLNDALAVKPSLDKPMLRPLLSVLRAGPGVETAATAASPPSTPSGEDDRLSSFLLRSQEKRKRFSSTLKLLMGSREGADGQQGLRMEKEKEVTIGWWMLFLFHPCL